MSANPCNVQAETGSHAVWCCRSPQSLRLIASLATWILAILCAAPPVMAHTEGEVASSRLSTPAAGSTHPTEVPGAPEPLTASDRDLLVKVRLAGLWEMPAGDMAAQKGASSRVREVGSTISSQHQQLDSLVIRAVQQLDVQLPDEPNAEQRGWLDEMNRSTGPLFDQVFVTRLRGPWKGLPDHRRRPRGNP